MSEISRRRFLKGVRDLLKVVPAVVVLDKLPKLPEPEEVVREVLPDLLKANQGNGSSYYWDGSTSNGLYSKMQFPEVDEFEVRDAIVEG